MIVLAGDTATARRQLNALQAMLRAIGAAQARFLSVDQHSATRAEAASLSIERIGSENTLSIDADQARSGRGGNVSWVLRRLIQMARHENVEVHVSTPETVGSLYRAFGGTLPDRHIVNVSGGSREVLPGPHDRVDVSSATLHPQTRAERSDLDIGRTLVHELVIHGWRESFFYQPSDPSHPRPPHRIATFIDATHHGRSHAPSSRGRSHNLADGEADLIDYYYDLARGHDISYGAAMHDEFERWVRGLGVMGHPITQWERSPAARRMRAAAAEMAAERRRFMHAASQFQRQVERMRQLEYRVGRSTTAMEQRLSSDRRAHIADARDTNASVPTQESRTIHRVQRGENLSIIARKYYGSPREWRRIYNSPENRQIIGRNPNLIYPGQLLVIPS